MPLRFSYRLFAIAVAILTLTSLAHAEPEYRAEFVFPLNAQHNHAPGIVECPNGDLLASWYRGSGERRADDVIILRARLKKGESTWSEPFLLADYSEFPDCNTCMMIDRHQKLWVFWPIILDNQWDSALTNYRVSSDYEGDGPPKWEWQGVIFLKPADFKEEALEIFAERMKGIPPEEAGASRTTSSTWKRSSPASFRSGWAGSRAASRPCFRPAAFSCRCTAIRFRFRSWPSATTTGKAGTPAAC